MRVTVLSENTPWEGFGGEHGLCLLAEYKGAKYLIDTGASGLFAENAKKLGIDLAGIQAAFLSHAHYDHSGGYREFFSANKTAKVYLQQAAKLRYYYKILGPVKKYIGIPEHILEDYPDRFEYVTGYKEFGNGIYILPHTTKALAERGAKAHMYCTAAGNAVAADLSRKKTAAGNAVAADLSREQMVAGKMLADDFSHEQTVVFAEEDGLVAFNSCSHAGVENIIEEIKQVFPEEKIKAFFGGFHMMGALGPESCAFSEEEVKKVGAQLKKSSDAVFYSGHCTGGQGIRWLSEEMGGRFHAMHAGFMAEV